MYMYARTRSLLSEKSVHRYCSMLAISFDADADAAAVCWCLNAATMQTGYESLITPTRYEYAT